MEIEKVIQIIKEFGLHHAIGDLPNSSHTVEAFEIAIKVLQKQIPKPLRRKYTNGTGVCDKCGQVVKIYSKYCSYCGNKLET
jgi:hypothetical protein